MNNPENLETVKQFAKRTGVSVNTVRLWMYRRIIPGYKIGDVIRIPVNRAMAAIEARTNRELAALEKT